MKLNQKLIPYVHTDGEKWDYFRVDPISQIIYFEKKHNGKRIKFSTKEKVPNGIKAKRFANLEFDRRTGKKIKQGLFSLIKEELESYLKLKETEGLKCDTMNNVRGVLQINEYWGKKLPHEITRDTFADWVSWWRQKHSDIQMENAIKYFNNFCTYLHQKVVNDRPLLPSSLRFKDPNMKQIKAKRARKKERIFTHEEFKLVHDTAANEVEALIVHLMYTMATRIDETLKLDFSRIILDRDVPVYRWSSDNNKAGKIGEHALHPSLIRPLKRLREMRRAEGTILLFPQLRDNQKARAEQDVDWDEWRKRADLDWHWTPHIFRHTCLTLLFNDAKNPQAIICKLYRTSLQVALETYIKVTQESTIAMRDSIHVDLSKNDSGAR